MSFLKKSSQIYFHLFSFGVFSKFPLHEDLTKFKGKNDVFAIFAP